MPLQNKVDPKGRLVAVSARGEFLGNRGILHDENKTIVSPWKHKGWVTCQLSFKDIKREVFSPNNYSELFFLDEATAFSAGHRPCAYCRRERYNQFKKLWLSVIAEDPKASLSITAIDKQLHTERAGKAGSKVTYSTEFKNIPFGTFVEIEDEAYIVLDKELKKWSHHGYIKTNVLPGQNETVTVLTPYSTVQLYAQGFKPQIHSSFTE